MTISMCTESCKDAYSDACVLGEHSCVFYYQRYSKENVVPYGYCSWEDKVMLLVESCDGCSKKCLNGKFTAE